MIISDLRAEKKLVEYELKNMVDNRFATNRDDEFQKEIVSLRQSLAQISSENESVVSQVDLLQKQLLDNCGISKVLLQYYSLRQKMESKDSRPKQWNYNIN